MVGIIHAMRCGWKPCHNVCNGAFYYRIEDREPGSRVESNKDNTTNAANWLASDNASNS